MAYTAAIVIVGDDGNPFPGDSLKATNANKDINDVLSVSFTVQRSTDAAKGAFTTELKNLPVIVQKELGAATPRVLASMRQNETLKEVQVRFYRAPKGNGSVEEYYRITLHDARINKHRIFTGRAGQEGSQISAKPISEFDSNECEEIEFSYAILTEDYYQGSHKDGPGNQTAVWKWKDTHSPTAGGR